MEPKVEKLNAECGENSIPNIFLKNQSYPQNAQ